ncbi:hypothetical protein SAMN05216275_110216 [Streptosporangium canum]|uniref:Uncharacterized protein n=1 Tax=Streptosporangium canum TaxID=324952 RepID=A0A1I3T006_9ACTN|nr:hypothetical protein SAMN05216275_110216 [Streptosporangium canum]
MLLRSDSRVQTVERDTRGTLATTGTARRTPDTPNRSSSAGTARRSSPREDA